MDQTGPGFFPGSRPFRLIFFHQRSSDVAQYFSFKVQINSKALCWLLY